MLNGKLVGASFSGQDAIDAFYKLSGDLNTSKAFEAMYQQFYALESNNEGNGGGDGKFQNYKDWFDKQLQYKFLNNFTFEDAIYHYNFGEGEPITVNLNSLNFDDITVERFLKSEKRYQDSPLLVVNFLGDDQKKGRTQQGLIYGSITLVYIGHNKIMALPDECNFKQHRGKTFTRRNILTFLGSLYNGRGTSYFIFFKGTAKIEKK